MDVLMGDNGSFYCNIYGRAEGTNYSVVYQDDRCNDLQREIEELFQRFEHSLSVYDPTSLISRINRNEDVIVDPFFEAVFHKAKQISLHTQGAFDISAEPLFRAWGFSAQQKDIPTPGTIDRLKQSIGMDQITIDNGRVLKNDPSVLLNVNAIAKGYSADIIADLLDAKGCLHYLVEVGGEIRAKGQNLQGESWSIGIDSPDSVNSIPGQDLQAILRITDRGIATSGNYRQFYMHEGRKIGHTIDPRTGYPADHNLLSVTVIADDCMTADAYATAFMVAGVEQAGMWLEDVPDMGAIFICDEDGEYRVYCTYNVHNFVTEP